MFRIALIHALADSVVPINTALARDWPEAVRMNLVDDSLSTDLARSGRLDERMTARFVALADYAAGTGAHAIQFTCSAFGPCIEAAARRHAPLPVFKPNEAMIDEAVGRLSQPSGADGQAGWRGRLGLVASFAPTLASMRGEFPPGMPLDMALAEGALAALQAGDTATHDRLVADAAAGLAAAGCTVIALAQFSLARSRDEVARRTGLPVLTTVDTAVRRLRSALEPRT